MDHHAPQGLVEPEYSDIRPVGAAATILTDYLRGSEVMELDDEEIAHVRLATAVMHGLRSETSGFRRAGPDEYVAASFLSRYTDRPLREALLGTPRTLGGQ